VSPALLQRQAALAGVALLATLGALALTTRGGSAPPPIPVSLQVPWQAAVVGVLPPSAYARKTACGFQLDSGTRGIAHPVLPCGVDLELSFGGRQVRTEVVARTRVAAGREFDLTQALAEELGIHGTEEIRWRFPD
jgi:hypothetical protein